MSDTIQIHAVVDPSDDQWINLMVTELMPNGQANVEHYQVKRTQRYKPGKVSVKLSDPGKPKQPESLSKRVRRKVKEYYGE
jgi:hypothetical protein